MEIASFVHKGLKLLYEQDNAAKVDPSTVDKLRNILSFLQAMGDAAELKVPPNWGAYAENTAQGYVEPDRDEELRLTFDVIDDEIHTLNLEDYH